jgi:hypothetical protein
MSNFNLGNRPELTAREKEALSCVIGCDPVISRSSWGCNTFCEGCKFQGNSVKTHIEHHGSEGRLKIDSLICNNSASSTYQTEVIPSDFYSGNGKTNTNCWVPNADSVKEILRMKKFEKNAKIKSEKREEVISKLNPRDAILYNLALGIASENRKNFQGPLWEKAKALVNCLEKSCL